MERNILKYATTTLQPTQVASTAMQSGAALLNSVSRQTGQMADEALAEWQKARVAEATTEGQTAGGLPQVDYRPNDGTLTAQAYNQAASRTHMSVMTTTMQAKLNELQDQFPTDPEAYLKESNGFIDGVVREMKSNPESARYADQFAAQAKLQQESQGYTIARKYQAQVIENSKVANEDFMFGVKNDTYRNASGIFSKDPTEQAYTLNQFANAKKMFDAALHQVTPDGKAVYSAGEIQKMTKEFHTEYYTKAMKDYIASDAISTEEIVDVLSNKAKVKVALDGGGTGEIDVLSEMGTESYDKIKSYTMTKMRERSALEKAERALEEKENALQKKYNAFHLATSIASGGTVPLDQIDGMLERGEIDYAGAVSARTMALNPANRDDVHAVATINTEIANGADAQYTIAQYANVLSPQTIIKLSSANEEMQVKGKNSLYKEHLKMLKSEFGEKTMFGDFTDTNMAAVFNDISIDYMDMVKEGMSPDLAFEKMRTYGETVKKANDMNKFSRFKEVIVKSEGKLDKAASFDNIKRAYSAGEMDENLALYYMDKLKDTEE